MTLTFLSVAKDRVRERLPKIGYHRQSEYEAVLGLVDELLDGVLDDADISDKRADAVLGAIGAFLDSTHRPELNELEDWSE